MVLLILVPLLVGLLAYLVRPARRYLSVAAGAFGTYLSVRLFLDVRHGVEPLMLPRVFGIANSLTVDYLSAVVLMLVSAFALLIFVYAFRFSAGPRDDWRFFTFALLTYGAANGALLAGSVLVLYLFWGTLLFTVYALLFYGKGDTEASARKMFLLNGVADFLLLFGLFVLIMYTKQFGTNLEPGQLSYFPTVLKEKFVLDNPLAIIAFILIAIGALTKAGSFPLHTWIPKAAETAPAESMAFIPASLDKILGIYLFVRLCYSMFEIRTNMTLQVIFLSIGAVTILIAVFMALVQNDAAKLLSYLTISQVGYMVLGIASGSILGIAGGLFHMINGSFYKSALFLTQGAVQRQTGETNLEKLGGLARAMPVTFLCFAIAGLAISGVPPLNGFVSKWMIYQALVDIGSKNPFFYIFLVVGLFGSVLTLASVLKLAHSIFLGRKPKALEGIKEAPVNLWLPPVIFTCVSLAFGLFAFKLPLPYLVSPALSASAIVPQGFFSPLGFAALMLILLSVGVLVYFLGGSYAPRKRKVFTGAEELTEEEMHFAGPHFYSSIKNVAIFSELFKFAEGGSFDIFHYIEAAARAFGKTLKRIVDDSLNTFAVLIKRFLDLVGKGFSLVHTGRLPFYVAWLFLGMLLLILLIFIKGGGGA